MKEPKKITETDCSEWAEIRKSRLSCLECCYCKYTSITYDFKCLKPETFGSCYYPRIYEST